MKLFTKQSVILYFPWFSESKSLTFCMSILRRSKVMITPFSRILLNLSLILWSKSIFSSVRYRIVNVFGLKVENLAILSIIYRDWVIVKSNCLTSFFSRHLYVFDILSYFFSFCGVNFLASRLMAKFFFPKF